MQYAEAAISSQGRLVRWILGEFCYFKVKGQSYWGHLLECHDSFAKGALLLSDMFFSLIFISVISLHLIFVCKWWDFEAHGKILRCFVTCLTWHLVYKETEVPDTLQPLPAFSTRSMESFGLSWTWHVVKRNLGLVAQAWIPALTRQREDCSELGTSLIDYIVSSSSN